jgi:phosphatidylserine decarboxylase
MDPFVVVSFGKKVFRTRVIRHSLNPVWDEKLLFHVRKYEQSYRVQLTVLDWDKLSSNDYVGDAAIEIADLAAAIPKKDPDSGLYPEYGDGTGTFHEFKLPLATAKEMPWESKYNPIIACR